MKPTWMASVCALLLALSMGAVAQDNGSSNSQDNPVLKTRPNTGTNNTQSNPSQSQTTVYSPNQTNGAPPNAIPEGTRFIIKLKDTLDTKKMEQGKRFKAELREDLTTSSGLVEGMNNKAKLTMRKSYGFRTFRVLELSLYHSLWLRAFQIAMRML